MNLIIQAFPDDQSPTIPRCAFREFLDVFFEIRKVQGDKPRRPFKDGAFYVSGTIATQPYHAWLSARYLEKSDPRNAVSLSVSFRESQDDGSDFNYEFPHGWNDREKILVVLRAYRIDVKSERPAI